MAEALMKAVVITEPGGPEVLSVRDVPRPSASGDQVLVRVAAAGINRADVLQRQGKYPAPRGESTTVPGLEFSGVVEALGPLVSGNVAVGDRVCGLVGGGAYAEYVAVAEGLLMPCPQTLALQQAAGIPEAFLTALDALETQGGLRPGETVLISAVGSGVGLAAVQVAKAMGCRTIGTSRTESKLREATVFGLDHALDARRKDLAEEVMRVTAGKGVDVLIDFVGAAALEVHLKALALCGRMVAVGTLSGSAAVFDLGVLLRKRLRLTGTVLRPRPLHERVTLTKTFAARVLPWFDAGLLKVPIDTVFALDDVAAAHRRMEANKNFGKMVLELNFGAAAGAE